MDLQGRLDSGVAAVVALVNYGMADLQEADGTSFCFSLLSVCCVAPGWPISQC